MAISLSSPVTGGAQTGFTSPTYTVAIDNAPDLRSKQYVVTAVGGTQAGVSGHNVQMPFTLTYFRPESWKTLPALQPNGTLGSLPYNSQRILVRKGAVPLPGQNARVNSIDITVNVAAGTETNDAANVKAMISAAIGALNQLSAGLGDTTTSGIV